MTSMFHFCSNLKTIYVGDLWDVKSVNSSGSMFSNCSQIVGGEGTTYNSSAVNKTYAHIDGGESNPGYLTAVSSE